MSTIVVAIGERTLRDSFLRVLWDKKFSAIAAQSHEQAVGFAENDSEISLIIVNLGHDATGIKLWQRFKEREFKARFIITSGGASQEMQDLMKERGITFLPIPCDIDAIISTVQQELSRVD